MHNEKRKAILPMLLTELRLPTIQRSWEDQAKEAEEKGLSYPQYLSNLCELEVNERGRRRLSRHMIEAQLPRAKTLESYNFSAILGITKSKVLGLASGEAWVKDGMNVLIFGSSGVGKTHLAAAIGENSLKMVSGYCLPAQQILCRSYKSPEDHSAWNQQ